MIELVVLGLGWSTYFLLHSILASIKVKEQLKSFTGWSNRSYRIFYTMISVVGLFVMVVFLAYVSKGPLFVVSSVSKYISLSIAVVGVVVIRRAFHQYDLGEFLGLREEKSPQKIKKGGILNYIRHPLYSGTILILLAMFLYSPTMGTLITTLVTMLYLAVAIPLEEKKLIDQFGEQYQRYKRDVPALIPRIRKQN